jgi:beta-lactamase regulating signal transducer with metallopeptidase domain
MKAVLNLLAVVLLFIFGGSFVLFHVRPPEWIAVPLLCLWIIGSILGVLFVIAAFAQWCEKKDAEIHSPMGKKR